MLKDGKILIGKSEEKELCILPQMANRHGLITGATGSGKTITLKVMAESFSEMGVPVFLSDIKGDLAGTCIPGTASEKLSARLEKLGVTDFKYKGFPVVFWDVFGKEGHPVRAAIQDIDPVILSAYKTTRPLTFLAARPIVCIKDVSERKNPSLSASKIATKAHSGISNPSRNKLIPTRTLKTPLRKSLMI